MQFLALLRLIYRFRKIISILTMLETALRLYNKSDRLRNRKRDRDPRKDS